MVQGDATCELARSKIQLIQSERMASIGLLAAGIAHEINSPISYLKCNLGMLETYVKNFIAVLDAYEKVELSMPDRSELFAGVAQLKKDVELSYLKQDVAALLSESREGVVRVNTIVQNLMDFSHIDSNDRLMRADIHHGLDSTLEVISSEITHKCDVVKEYGALPQIECLPSQLNHVFLNLLINAIEAIETRGTITIRTGTVGNEIWIEIADTGKGISPEHLDRIFDPFFTTKPAGKGTGLGLAISLNIIQRHRGILEVESALGKGTVFKVILPCVNHS